MEKTHQQRGTPHRPHNTLSSAQPPRFNNEPRSPQLEIFETPSPRSEPVEVNEEWVRSFRARLSGLQQFSVEESPSLVSSSGFGDSTHSLRLGDSSSRRPVDVAVLESLLQTVREHLFSEVRVLQNRKGSTFHPLRYRVSI